MAHHGEHHYNLDQRFDFTASIKKSILTVLVIGAVLLGIGVVMAMTGGHHEEGAEAGTHAFHWMAKKKTPIMAIPVKNTLFTQMLAYNLSYQWKACVPASAPSS